MIPRSLWHLGWMVPLPGGKERFSFISAQVFAGNALTDAEVKDAFVRIGYQRPYPASGSFHVSRLVVRKIEDVYDDQCGLPDYSIYNNRRNENNG